MDPSLWFLNGFESRAPEQPASGEVDGDDDEDDKERTRLHRRCEIKKRGVLCRAMCQCRPPVAQEATGGGEEERRLEAGEGSHRRSGESQRGE